MERYKDNPILRPIPRAPLGIQTGIQRSCDFYGKKNSYTVSGDG